MKTEKTNSELKIGDKINVDGFITELKDVAYCPFAKLPLYWFFNERGEYKYNLREFITKA